MCNENNLDVMVLMLLEHRHGFKVGEGGLSESKRLVAFITRNEGNNVNGKTVCKVLHHCISHETTFYVNVHNTSLKTVEIAFHNTYTSLC